MNKAGTIILEIALFAAVVFLFRLHIKVQKNEDGTSSSLFECEPMSGEEMMSALGHVGGIISGHMTPTLG